MLLGCPKTSTVPLKRQIQSPGVNCCAITNATRRSLEASSQSWVLKASRREISNFEKILLSYSPHLYVQPFRTALMLFTVITKNIPEWALKRYFSINPKTQ